jgi:hypothetical protein
MRTKGIVFGILLLFAVIALSATGAYAEEQESSIVAVSSIGTLYGSGLGITDDLAVADGCEEIKYDDGEAEDALASRTPGLGIAVHFTVINPDYDRLKTARFAIILNESISSNSFDWEVLEWTAGAPGSVIVSGTTDPAEHGWCDVDMNNIDIPKDFVIAMYWKHEELAPYLGYDEDTPINNRSLLYFVGEWFSMPHTDFMIRAVVCPENGGTPDIDVTPVEIEAELEPGGTTSKTLDIRNEGDVDLTYSSISISYDASSSMLAATPAPGLEKLEAIAATASLRGTAVSEGVEIGYDDG